MQEKTLSCVDCHSDFAFSVEEQKKFQKLGFDDPKRCYACRKARKAAKERQQ